MWKQIQRRPNNIHDKHEEGNINKGNLSKNQSLDKISKQTISKKTSREVKIEDLRLKMLYVIWPKRHNDNDLRRDNQHLRSNAESQPAKTWYFNNKICWNINKPEMCNKNR